MASLRVFAVLFLSGWCLTAAVFAGEESAEPLAAEAPKPDVAPATASLDLPPPPAVPADVADAEAQLKAAVLACELAKQELGKVQAALAEARQAYMDLLEARRQVQVTLAAAVQAALELQAVRAQGDETPEKKKAIETALRTSQQAEDAYGKATHRVDINEQLLRAKMPAWEQVQKNWGSTRQDVVQAMEAATESVADCMPTLRTRLPDAPQVTPSVPPAPPADAAGFPVPGRPHPATPALAACEVGDLRQRVDAFACLPRVTEISAEDCPTETAQTENPKFMPDAGEKTAAKTPCDVFVVDHRFDQPARFPIPAFGLAGESLEEPGVVIYEGMRLAIRPDGRYQVRFVAETPAMPVTMRLQFILADQWTGTTVPLTLPPITIPAESSPKRSATQGTVRPVAARQQNIHHEGRLPILDLSPEGLQVVSRSGVARIGYGLHVP